MDRNDDRWWFDRGYSLGVVETQRDAVIPRLILVWTVFAATVWNPLLAAPFLVLYTIWTLLDWRDRRDQAEHKRDVHDPGPTWNWQTTKDERDE